MAIRFVFWQGVVVLVLVLLCSHSAAPAGENDDPVKGIYRTAPSDLYALKQLWSAWNGTPEVMSNLAGWNALANESENTPCAPESPWRGVFCNAKRNVADTAKSNTTVWDLEITGLALANASLLGVIPEAIGNLSNLVTLSLVNNRGLKGPLPQGLENLGSLFELDVHGNNITGELPNWKQDSVVFLQNINVADNQMTGSLPINRSNSFRAVQTFNLSYNLFAGDFHNLNVFGYLHKAVAVDWSYNGFTGRMPFLINSTDNGTSIPITGPLTYLDLSSNKFDQLLPNITGNKALQHLNVSNNRLTGSLNPTSLTNVPTLTTMDLSNNLFTGPIPNLTSLENLLYLDMSYNNFIPGPFPSWTTELNNIATLLLRGVSLSGDVPSSILVGFKNLKTLTLDDNNLTGTLDLNNMLVVPNRSWSLQLVSLRNNQIRQVSYSGQIVNLTIKFFLQGNPYCDNSTSTSSDLARCVCQQQCSDTPGTPSNKILIIIAIVVSMSVLAVVISIFSFIFWRSRKKRRKLILGVEQKFAEYEVKPTIYTYNELQSITRGFSMKLGQGAFGAVYKGTLPSESEVAVKQLYTKSQQSLDDFLNEIILVAAVKHKNLVKLKGCCIQKNQRLLVYEYVENGDLEHFLFGQEMGKKDWSTRKNICYGVAEGIHYLHISSQPKIIHRDIKACNILLDNKFEPKIADFGLALLYPDEESHIMTIHVAGTRGYLAPEYAQLGYLSEKVDVFSYGVLLLEIVSKRRNMNLISLDDYFYLPEWAWNLYIEGKIKELIDPNLELQPREEMEALRVVNIALLCVHGSAESRPDMKAVVAMLHGGMDAEILRLVEEHERDRVLSSKGQHSLGFGHSNSRGSETSSFNMSKASQSLSFIEKSSLVNKEPSGSSLVNQNLPA